MLIVSISSQKSIKVVYNDVQFRASLHDTVVRWSDTNQWFEFLCGTISTQLWSHLFLIPILGYSTGSIVRKDIKGRLLTPEEGCGYSNVANSRIIGGTTVVPGAWPWLVY